MPLFFVLPQPVVHVVFASLRRSHLLLADSILRYGVLNHLIVGLQLYSLLGANKFKNLI